MGGALPYTDPLLLSQGKYAEAEPLYKRLQAIREKALGPEHPAVAAVLNNRAGLLESQVRAEIISRKVVVVFSGCLLYHRASLLESGDGHQNFQGTVLWTGGMNVNFE